VSHVVNQQYNDLAKDLTEKVKNLEVLLKENLASVKKDVESQSK
jgi:hypothetical protein